MVLESGVVTGCESEPTFGLLQNSRVSQQGSCYMFVERKGA